MAKPLPSSPVVQGLSASERRRALSRRQLEEQLRDPLLVSNHASSVARWRRRFVRQTTYAFWVPLHRGAVRFSFYR